MINDVCIFLYFEVFIIEYFYLFFKIVLNNGNKKYGIFNFIINFDFKNF